MDWKNTYSLLLAHVFGQRRGYWILHGFPQVYLLALSIASQVHTSSVKESYQGDPVSHWLVLGVNVLDRTCINWRVFPERLAFFSLTSAPLASMMQTMHSSLYFEIVRPSPTSNFFSITSRCPRSPYQLLQILFLHFRVTIQLLLLDGLWHFCGMIGSFSS